MERTVKKKVKGFLTKDGAGVQLVRVLGHDTIQEFDPILMLDSFDSTNPSDYTVGFPMHPHRGIETITYIAKGNIIHKDSLGNQEEIGDGEVQWMSAGSGIMHEEMLPVSNRLLGVQLWLNLPSEYKMSNPSYTSIKHDKIPEIQFSGGMLRLLAGRYEQYQSYIAQYLPMNYYDIHLQKNAQITLQTHYDDSIMLFTLLGCIYIDDVLIEEKTAVKLTQGDYVSIKTKDEYAQVLYISSKALHEPVAWAGPIVMNTEKELYEAFEDLENHTFIKKKVTY